MQFQTYDSGNEITTDYFECNEYFEIRIKLRILMRKRPLKKIYWFVWKSRVQFATCKYALYHLSLASWLTVKKDTHKINQKLDLESSIATRKPVYRFIWGRISSWKNIKYYNVCAISPSADFLFRCIYLMDFKVDMQISFW